jgi:ABC-type spermidine/putrescine transport system permease subunit I
VPSLVDGVAAERPGAGGSARPRVPAGLALSLPLTAWLIAGFALPLAIVLLLSVQAETDMFAPVSLVPSATQYVELITDGFMVGVFVRTLLLAAAVTAASAVLAYPLALWLVRLPPKWRAAGMTLVLVPLLTNVVVRSLGLMLVLAPAGPIGEIAALFGLPRPNLLFGWFAVWLALTQVFMPFMVMAL